MSAPREYGWPSSVFWNLILSHEANARHPGQVRDYIRAELVARGLPTSKHEWSPPWAGGGQIIFSNELAVRRFTQSEMLGKGAPRREHSTAILLPYAVLKTWRVQRSKLRLVRPTSEADVTARLSWHSRGRNSSRSSLMRRDVRPHKRRKRCFHFDVEPFGGTAGCLGHYNGTP